MQLLPSLLSELQAVCATFPDRRKGRGGNIAAADFGLSAFAMFFMQSASFLAYQRTMEKGHGRSNCRTLFGIGRIPSDNYIRDFLDEADPALLQPCFERMEALLSEPPMRRAFGRLGGRTLIALDGTEFFCSQKLGCPHCLTRKRANGKTESYHSMLSATVVTPGHSKVVPLAPHRAPGRRRKAGLRTQRRQALVRQAWRAAGAVAPRVPRRRSVRLPPRRQDDHGCRRRFHLHLQADFPQDAVRLHRRGRVPPPRGESPPPQYERDAPFSLDRGGPAARRQGRDPGQLDCLRDRRRQGQGHWVTSLPVFKDNVAEIVACGRARWKIENESFNVLKNHGYELEHNFGHGQRFLAMTLAALNLLAFAWHTVLELLEPPWQAAREAAVKRTSFFAHILIVERLRNLSLLAGFPPIPRHLLDPAEPHKSRRQPANVEKVPTSRIAEFFRPPVARTARRARRRGW